MTNHAFITGMNEIGVTSDGFKLSALLFVPENADAEQPKPGIVIARPGTGVKEQTAAVYAEALCKLGFVTLAFDAKGFGDSEGQHKQVENPYSVVEDIKNCTSFLNSLAIVDSSKLFNVGICMGAGYAYYATALDARVKAVGMISPYLNAAEQNIAAFGNVKNLRDYYLSGTSAARQLHFDTGDDTYFSPVPETKEAEASVLPIAAGMTQYYLPGHPGAECGKWKNELNLYNAESILTFSAFNVISLMDDIPLFMALGSEAYTADNNLSFFEQASDPKELLLFERKGHFDLYWQPECVAPASEKLAEFLLSHA